MREAAARGGDASRGGGRVGTAPETRVGTAARRRVGHRGIDRGSASDETRPVDDARVRLALVADRTRVGVESTHRGRRAARARARGGVPRPAAYLCLHSMRRVLLVDSLTIDCLSHDSSIRPVSIVES